MPVSAPGSTTVILCFLVFLRLSYRPPFQTVLNAAARLIARLPRFSHISSYIKEHLHWLPSSTKFSLLSLRPKWGWHLNIFVTRSDFRPLPNPFVHNAPLTGGSSYIVTWTRTTMSKSRSFTVAGLSLWNRLPPSARASFSSSNLSTSLSLLKSCLFSWS